MKPRNPRNMDHVAIGTQPRREVGRVIGTHIRATSGRRDRGVIIVIVLLALVLLASMVFYIFNVGHHVSRRVEAQNAADNAALSGGRWMARSFNTVAANNVEMARLIALAGVLDAVPLSLQHTLEDQQAVLEALERQGRSGYGQEDWVREAVANIVRPNIQQQVEYLDPLNDLFNGGDYDVARMTFFELGDDNRGELWQAIEALSGQSEAVMENLGVLAQQSAFRGAQISQREAGLSSGGLLLPWLPEVPWEKGGFEDFERPIAEGQLPVNQDDAEFNRGPFDVLFGQRELGQLEDVDFTELPTDGRNSGGALGWSPPPQTRSFTRAEVETYFTTGTYQQLIDQVRELSEVPPIDSEDRRRNSSREFYPAPTPPTVTEDQSPLAPSLWGDRVSFAANAKINRLFPGTAPAGQVVFDPDWVTDRGEAEEIEEIGSQPIVYGLYLTLEFRRTKTSATFPVTFSEPELIYWGLRRSESNPLEPPLGSGTSLRQVTDQLWREELPENDDPGFGEDDEQFLIYQVWLGINVGEEVVIRNPYNIEEESRDELPGPVNFVVGEFEPGQPETREALRLLGVAHQPREAPFWPERFDEDRPDTKMVALAQAEVFNNHSWDLWTAMWHSQLTPVEGVEDWLDTLEDPVGTEIMPWLNEEDVTAVTNYLRATEPLMELMVGDE